MNMFIPFICLAAGVAINWKGLPQSVLRICDWITNFALLMLMVVIGLNIGTSSEVMNNIGKIGLNCVIISVTAVAASVLLTVLAEKTVMPLEKIREQMEMEKISSGEAPADDGKISPLIIVMPTCILLGIIGGRIFLSHIDSDTLDFLLTVSLIFLYTGVGISCASSKSVFGYICRLGLRILFLPAAILAGCLAGGTAAGLILRVPLHISVISAGGMGYYSLTGAFLTGEYGIQAGVYGFIVNVLRDVITIAALPLLTKISKGSPIASGAAGCMDTMLVPVTKAVGPELGLVALLSGTILTVAVPFILPLIAGLF